MHAVSPVFLFSPLAHRAAHFGRPMPTGFVWLLFLGLGCAAITPVSAGTIYWDMQTLAATSSTDAIDLVIGELSRGQAGTTLLLDALQSSSGYQFSLDGSTTSASGANNAQAAALGGALQSGSSAYFSVTLTNTSGHLFFLTGIGFGSRSTSTGPQRYSVRSSLDGFATTISGGTGDLAASSNWAYVSTTYAAPLALPVGQPVEVRLYGSDGTATQRTAGNWRIDDLQFVVVPEPAAGAMGVLLVFLVTAVRRLRAATVRRASRT